MNNTCPYTWQMNGRTTSRIHRPSLKLSMKALNESCTKKWVLEQTRHLPPTVGGSAWKKLEWHFFRIAQSSAPICIWLTRVRWSKLVSILKFSRRPAQSRRSWVVPVHLLHSRVCFETLQRLSLSILVVMDKAFLAHLPRWIPPLWLFWTLEKYS